MSHICSSGDSTPVARPDNTNRRYISLGRPKFNNNPHTETGRPEVIQRLSDVQLVMLYRRLDLHQDLPLNNQVGPVFAHGVVLVDNTDGHLPGNLHPSRRQLRQQSVLVYILQEPAPKLIGDLKGGL